MIQILVPLAGPSTFFQEGAFPYPKPLIEINGIPMIQRVIESLQSITGEKKFIFMLNEKDCTKFHLDDTIQILTEKQGAIITLKNPTHGAVCSALMAIDVLDQEQPLLISNGDQIVEQKLNDAITFFLSHNYDGGVVTFQSVHPKWSYIRTEDSIVIEAAEKRPISRNAIAGIYYYKQAGFFTESAFQTIFKDSNHDGVFYVSSTLNEMILKNLKIGHFPIENRYYHSFYSPQKIQEFEQALNRY